MRDRREGDDDGLALLKTTKNTEGSEEDKQTRIEHVTGQGGKKKYKEKNQKDKEKKRKTTTRNYCNRVYAKRKKTKARPVPCRSMPTGSGPLFAPATCRKLINGQGPGWVSAVLLTSLAFRQPQTASACCAPHAGAPSFSALPHFLSTRGKTQKRKTAKRQTIKAILISVPIPGGPHVPSFRIMTERDVRV